jgi:hypothetical protein
MKGKKLPAIGRVEINIIEESNPRFLAFDSKQLDFVYVPTDFVNRVIAGRQAQAEFAQQGIQWLRTVEPSFTYTFFNMDDPTIGGYTPEKIALRRAIVQGYNVDEEIRVIRQGQAMPATQPIPAGLARPRSESEAPDPVQPGAGESAASTSSATRIATATAFANCLAASRWCSKLWTEPTRLSRQFDELWKRSMDAIGIRTDFVKQKWPETLKEARGARSSRGSLAESRSVREGESFLNHLYSKMIGIVELRATSAAPNTTGCSSRRSCCRTVPERNKLYPAAIGLSLHACAGDDRRLPLQQRAVASVDRLEVARVRAIPVRVPRHRSVAPQRGTKEVAPGLPSHRADERRDDVAAVAPPPEWCVRRRTNALPTVAIPW